MLSSNPITTELIKARELIADEKNWCQHTLREMRLSSKGETHFAHCVRGAIIYGTDNYKVLDGILARAAFDLGLIDHSTNLNYGDSGVVYVNNALGHAAVMQMFDKAIETSLKD